MDLTNEWEEGQQNGNHRENRRGMMSNGNSQDDRREQFYQYRNGNVSREDFGEELRRGRSEVTVISNAVLNHLSRQERRPTNRVSLNLFDELAFLINFCHLLELKSSIGRALSRKGARLRITRSC